MDEKTKEIVRAGCDLFLKYGIKSVSMDDLAASLGISKKTLYKFIKDKRHLVEMVVDSLLTRSKFHSTGVKTNLNALQEYVQIHKEVVQFLSAANFSAEFDLQKYYPDLYKKLIINRQAKMIKGVTLNLKKGIREGLYRRDLDVDAVARLNLMLNESMHDAEFMNNNRNDFLHMLDVSFDLFIHGIVSEKGLKEYNRIKSKQK